MALCCFVKLCDAWCGIVLPTENVMFCVNVCVCVALRGFVPLCVVFVVLLCFVKLSGASVLDTMGRA